MAADWTKNPVLCQGRGIPVPQPSSAAQTAGFPLSLLPFSFFTFFL
jgi:hypothetical protein